MSSGRWAHRPVVLAEVAYGAWLHSGEYGRDVPQSKSQTIRGWKKLDLQSYLRTIRKNWWLILLAALLGGGAGVGINAQATPKYSSFVDFYVSTPTDASGGNAYQANQYALSKIESYTSLLTSEELARRIISKSGLAMTPAGVAGEITASTTINTVLLTATVTDASPERSFAIAKAIATEFGPYIDLLETRTSKTGVADATVVLNVTSGPTLRASPVSPKKETNIALGVIGGLVVGLILALLRSLLDTTIRSAQALRAILDVPVLASIPLDRTAKKAPLIINHPGRSLRAEAFRQLRTNLQFIDVERPVRVLVVTSSIANEGKSSTATNLAIAFSEAGKKVLLIEGDLRRPRVADYLGLERAVGLTNVLLGEVELDQVLQPWGTTGMFLLASGSIPPNPSELLGSKAMLDMMEKLRQRFDVIVLDTPPLLPVTDGAVAAAHADGAVLVVRHGKASKTQVAVAQRSLEAVDARLLGTILNMSPTKGVDSYESHGYGYYEDDPKKHPKIATEPNSYEGLEVGSSVGESEKVALVDHSLEAAPRTSISSTFVSNARLRARHAANLAPRAEAENRDLERADSATLSKRSRRSKKGQALVVMREISKANRGRKGGSRA